MENHPTRVNCYNPNMYRWKSWDANTPFAPSFDVPVLIEECGEGITRDLVKMCEHYKFSRDNWMQYNIFSMTDFVVGLLSDRIYQIYTDYMVELDLDPLSRDQLWIRGWGTTLENGKGIEHHSHAFHENTYLSGNICLSDLPTTTDYCFPYLAWYFNYWKVKNELGRITLFPSWLEHKVDANTTGQVRFSLAFDIFTEHTMNYIRENRKDDSVLQKTLRLSKRMDHV